jgi:hypothetical protein
MALVEIKDKQINFFHFKKASTESGGRGKPDWKINHVTLNLF